METETVSSTEMFLNGHDGPETQTMPAVLIEGLLDRGMLLLLYSLGVLQERAQCYSYGR